MIGDIMGISRYRMATDGMGVSTLVVFYDCPLRCKYCINSKCLERNKHLYEETERAAYTPKELIDILRKDEIYYLMTKGGVVFGGGEPLLQSHFIHEVCKLADKRWVKRIETSLNVPWRLIEPLIDDIDEWIIDIKAGNTKEYEDYTGQSFEDVSRNLYRMRDLIPKSKFRIRVPYIEGYTSEEAVKANLKWVESLLDVKGETFDYYIP